MSGKTARRLRKNHPFSKKTFVSKKTLALCAGLCISCAPITAGGEFLVSVFPQFTKPFGEAHSIQYGMGAGVKATVQDIVSNPKNLVFKEVEAAQVPRTLDDVDAAVINTNFAMQASLTPTKDAMFMEDKTSPYVNIVAVRNGDENRPEIKALMKALQSKEVKDFIDDKYKGAIVAGF